MFIRGLVAPTWVNVKPPVYSRERQRLSTTENTEYGNEFCISDDVKHPWRQRHSHKSRDFHCLHLLRVQIFSLWAVRCQRRRCWRVLKYSFFPYRYFSDPDNLLSTPLATKQSLQLLLFCFVFLSQQEKKQITWANVFLHLLNLKVF